MEDNPMKILYKYFGREKEEGQEILSISNIFYDMGNKENPSVLSRQQTEDEFKRFAVKEI